jgi:hypothetical protein
MEDVFHKDESKYTYNVSLDYNTANPFKKLLFIGAGSSSVGGIAFAIALRLAIGAATEFAILGAVAIAGLSTVIGVFTIIPGIIGIGIYELYRIYKNKNVKELYEGLKNVNNRRYEIERELYYKTLKEFESFVHNLARSGYNQFYKENVIAKTKEIIQIINPNNKQLSEDDLQKYLESIKNTLIINNQVTIKVIILGKTGVGKSTLINNIFELKNNKAKTNTNDCQNIEEGWPKKYPVNKEDTNIKWLEIYDTEGIEIVSSSDNKNTNDIDNHLSKILEYMNDDKNNPEKRIDII